MLYSKIKTSFHFPIKTVLLITCFMLSIPCISIAKAPGFSSVFGSNMVLPHDKPVTLSGYAEPETWLTLEAGGWTFNFNTNDKGQWKIAIPPLRAGGPYTIRLKDGNGSETVLENIMAGDIWLCSGQSNMAYPVVASVDQPDSYNKGHEGIRLFTAPMKAELNPQDVFTDPVSWLPASDENIKNFSAVCYFFARKKLEQDGIPVGLINASWGGSAIEAWISEQGLGNIIEYDRKVNQLRQYRKDQRKAEMAFAEDWMNWWQKSSDQGQVWKKGLLDTDADWRPAPLKDWKTYEDDRLKEHHGMIWFSAGFELTAEQQVKKASFVLGKIDEVDSTWINGKFIKNSFGYGTRREYPLDKGVLKTGTNQITVNILNTWGAGGMTGPAEDVGIKFDDGEFLPLGDKWSYRFIPKKTGFPPRSPWESVSGITGMFNGMISPLKPLTPDGVIWYQGESNAEASGTYHSLLSSLVTDWRRHFSKNFPFIIVQLPNYGEIAKTPSESGWAAIRNAQQQVALEDELAGLVVTHDAGDDNDIHPRKKYIVGERAALVAGALNGNGIADGIVPKVINCDSNTATLEFSPPLKPDNKEVEGFILCNNSGTCVFTEAEQTGSRIVVSLKKLQNADKIRYCWSDGGQCTLKALNNLPVSSFELSLTTESNKGFN